MVTLFFHTYQAYLAYLVLIVVCTPDSENILAFLMLIPLFCRCMKYQNFKDFEQSIGTCRILFVIIPSDQERADVLQKVIKKISGTVEAFSPEMDCRAFFDALQSPSLFGGETIVFLDECERLLKKEAEAIGEFLEKNSIVGYLLLGSRGKTLLKGIEKIGSVLDMNGEKPWEKEKRIKETLIAMAKSEGKRLSSDAASLLIEKLGSDLSTLTQEMGKLICSVGDRKQIEQTDIFHLSATNTNETPWQIAEGMIWEGENGIFDQAILVPLIFSLRTQLEVGLKIASLLENGIPFSEWSQFFPKIWPKTLEKRKEQVIRKGSAYFKKGLEILYKVETLTRSSSIDPKVLYDFFRANLYAR